MRTHRIPAPSVSAPQAKMHPAGHAELWPHKPHFILQWMDPTPTPPGTDRAAVGAGGQALTQHTGLSRTRQLTSGPEQEKTRPGKETSPDQAVSAPYLFARKHSRPKPALKQICELHTTAFSQEGRIQGQPPGLWFKQLGGWWVRLLRRERVGKRQRGGKQRKNSQEILKNTCGFPPACPPPSLPPPFL